MEMNMAKFSENWETHGTGKEEEKCTGVPGNQ